MGIDRGAVQGCYQPINSIQAMLEEMVDFPNVDAIADTTPQSTGRVQDWI